MAKPGPQKSPAADIGILGGTELYEIEGIKDVEECILKTPFGQPSDAYIIGLLEGKRVAFLSRHGRGRAIENCLVTQRALIPPELKKKLHYIIAKYIKE